VCTSRTGVITLPTDATEKTRPGSSIPCDAQPPNLASPPAPALPAPAPVAVAVVLVVAAAPVPTQKKTLT